MIQYLLSVDEPVPVESVDEPVPVVSVDDPVPVVSVDDPVPVLSVDDPVPVESVDDPVPVVFVERVEDVEVRDVVRVLVGYVCGVFVVLLCGLLVVVRGLVVLWEVVFVVRVLLVGGGRAVVSLQGFGVPGARVVI